MALRHVRPSFFENLAAPEGAGRAAPDDDDLLNTWAHNNLPGRPRGVQQTSLHYKTYLRDEAKTRNSRQYKFRDFGGPGQNSDAGHRNRFSIPRSRFAIGRSAAVDRAETLIQPLPDALTRRAQSQRWTARCAREGLLRPPATGWRSARFPGRFREIGSPVFLAIAVAAILESAPERASIFAISLRWRFTKTWGRVTRSRRSGFGLKARSAMSGMILRSRSCRRGQRHCRFPNVCPASID